jgi:hypothetical protein
MFLPRRWLTLFRPRHEEVVAQLAGEIARRCRHAVRERVSKSASGMSHEMLYGYVRAHAVGCVASEINALTARFPTGDGLRLRITAAAIDRLIELVLKDLPQQDSCQVVRAAA